MGSATEVECHLLISRDLGILPDKYYQEYDHKVVEIKRMLTSLMDRVRTMSVTEN